MLLKVGGVNTVLMVEGESAVKGVERDCSVDGRKDKYEEDKTMMQVMSRNMHQGVKMDMTFVGEQMALVMNSYRMKCSLQQSISCASHHSVYLPTVLSSLSELTPYAQDL